MVTVAKGSTAIVDVYYVRIATKNQNVRLPWIDVSASKLTKHIAAYSVVEKGVKLVVRCERSYVMALECCGPTSVETCNNFGCIVLWKGFMTEAERVCRIRRIVLHFR